MLNNLFCGGEDNMFLLLILFFILCGDGKGSCGGGFGGDNMMWLLILFLFMCNQDSCSC